MIKKQLGTEVVIIGAGPAGLFCALELMKNPQIKLTILEKNHTPGKKLLLTGGGHCNFTHAGSTSQFLSHYGKNGLFLKHVLKAFSNRELIQYFESRGLPVSTDTNGRVTPRSNRASDVLKVLSQDLSKKGVTIRFDTRVRSVAHKAKDRFEIHTDQNSFYCQTLVVACGGKSYPNTGSTGDGYAWVEALGHRIVTPRPALTQLYCQDRGIADLAGISLRGSKVSLWDHQRKIQSCDGDVLFTHRGLSGPAVQDISRHVEPKAKLTIQLIANTNRTEYERNLQAIWASNGKKALRTVIKSFGLSEKLTDYLLAGLALDGSAKVAQTSKKQRNIIVDTIFDLPVTISRRAGFETAMVTQGGVALEGVDPKTMQSNLVPGLFFAGEILDVDGDCGGYNLQAAFSTAYAVARENSIRGKQRLQIIKK